MGFPESFEVPPSAKGSFYKQIGNAVCPPVVRVIGERLIEAIERAEAPR